LRQQQDFAAAELCLRKALSLHPNYAEAYVNLGFLSLEQENLEAAENCYREAIRLQPDCALAHTCLGRILLRKGDFEAGWPEQEWRWQWKDFPSPHRNFAQPQWNGEAIGAARIFLHAEQGFGDTLQFLRYVPLVIDRLRDQGASILLEVHPELHRLAETIPGVTQLISRGDAIPDFDWHCPLMSLPMAFATTLNTLPAGVPYLHADAFLAECALSNHSRAECEPLRVGVAWAGSTIDRADKKRSISLSLFAPLFAVAGVSCYGLQRGFAFSEAESLKFPFVGHLDATGDFGTTAAVISRLDLIISVDTAVAHLAGALGKPVWILLPKPADWRWLADRSDSPWYPSAKLFRQKTAGDWESVIAEVAAALEHTVAARNFAEV
jgi:hypothetical protein